VGGLLAMPSFSLTQQNYITQVFRTLARMRPLMCTTYLAHAPLFVKQYAVVSFLSFAADSTGAKWLLVHADAQVGQHLLTVPQQLEMMVASEEDGENQNLRVALSAGTLPYYRKGAELEEYDTLVGRCGCGDNVQQLLSVHWSMRSEQE
jgi:hypothetical protein